MIHKSIHTHMPPTTRRAGRHSARLNVQATALSIQSRGIAASVMYNSDEDYDSDTCARMPLLDRVSAKLRSAVHAAWLDLEDEEGHFPHDHGHNLETVEPTLEALAEFLVEVEESILWTKDVMNFSDAPSDVKTVCFIYQRLMKHDLHIGTRMVLELKMLCDTYVAVYRGLDTHRHALGTLLFVRQVRTSSSSAEARATRMEPTDQTTGEALMQRVERLKLAIDMALTRCGENV